MSATVLNSCNLSFYQLQSYLQSWHAANANRSAAKENLNYGGAAGTSPSKCPPQPQSPEPAAADLSGASSSGSSGNDSGVISEMDKAKFKARLMELVRDTFDFDTNARVTLLMSVRLDDQTEALNVEVSEELPAKPACGPVAAAPPAGSASAGGSKRKSQAPQRMVPSGEDSFVPAPAAATAPSRDASSSFGVDLSTPGTAAAVAAEDEEPQPLNLSRHGSPSVGAAGSSSTPLKPAVSTSAAAAFQLNNPDLAFHPYLAAAVQQRVVRPPALLSAAHLPALAPAGLQLPPPPLSQQPQSQRPPQPQPQKPAAPRQVRSRRPGNRTFPCNQCGIVFQSLAGLSKHTFTTHKVYKCTFCAASFTQRSNLQRHSLKHVGFKPFECRCCRKSYYRKDHLVRHIEVTHPGFDPKLSIDTRLSSAECLQYLERKHESRDYTCLSGVVLSAATAAASASEGGISTEAAEIAEAAEAPAAAAGEATASMEGEGETEELLMLDEEFDEAEADAEFDEPMDEAEAEEDAEIDVVGSEEAQPILLEQAAE
ncbi:hypothetical protein BOX15_Mlig001153g3 [Macrostomum lignano]|uniref:C2H2-type domain-containing protein n=1 Tax=Macrostomum lignano TaxID=282301 RepID=A0A267GJD9_9PLAT|nr:hypothetical protein BOX15_Mlig001153g3 [Macrostomum lignano]